MAFFRTNEHGAVQVKFSTVDGDFFGMGINASHGVPFPANSTVEIDNERLINAAKQASAPLGIEIRGLADEQQ